MSNLSEILPKVSPTVTAIYAYWKARGDSETRRRYLGMSAIGEECERRLWYSFRHASAEEFEGRMYRLFNRGHREEEVVAQELRGAGYEVHLVGEDGKQFGFSDIGGHFRGHMDAAILGVIDAPKSWHVGEFKTHSSKSFAKLVKEGVAKAEPVHYAQMQIYMSKSGMDRALYVAINKDTDEVYVERIRHEPTATAIITAKARRIITATKPPARIAERRDDFRCKFCPAIDICHGSTGPAPAVPIKAASCRQCVHATPELDGDGRWSCAKHGKDLTNDDQDRCCPSFLFIPDFITFAEVADAHKTADGQDYIEFRNKADGSIWYHGPDRDGGHYAAEDLATLPVNLIGATSSVPAPGLLERYTGEHIKSIEVNPSEIPAAWQHLFDELVPCSISTENSDEWDAFEYTGGRLLIVSVDYSAAEIRINTSPDNEIYTLNKAKIDAL